MAPQTIAASAAASARANEAARIANEPAAIATIPDASESIPSIRLTRFASAAIQKIVSGYAAQPRSKFPISGSPTFFHVIPKATTGISAATTIPTIFTLASIPRMSSISPSAATINVPSRIPR